MKSLKFNMIKKYYDSGIWNIEMVHNVVAKKVITPEEFEEITGIKYKHPLDLL